jgi:arylsulfatase A-like enzyme
VNALCSPTRAALLSGRNDHEIGFGIVVEGASGLSRLQLHLAQKRGSIAEVLRQNGYSTAAFGKWRNTPVWEANPAGPFDHWPTSLGFEYFHFRGLLLRDLWRRFGSRHAGEFQLFQSIHL